MENFGKFMIALLVITIASIIKGFVITQLWLWFVVPIFEAEPLRIIEAIGLVFLINYITAKKERKELDKDEYWAFFIAKTKHLIALSGWALLSGWILQMFM
jgi:hypothetical protein